VSVCRPGWHNRDSTVLHARTFVSLTWPSLLGFRSWQQMRHSSWAYKLKKDPHLPGRGGYQSAYCPQVKWLRGIGVARIFTVGVHCTVDSDGDDLFSVIVLFSMLHWKPPKLTTPHLPSPTQKKIRVLALRWCTLQTTPKLGPKRFSRSHRWCILCTVIICTVLATSLHKHFLYWLIDWGDTSPGYAYVEGHMPSCPSAIV